MNCHKCNAPLRPGAKFCVSCGAPVAAQPADTPRPVSPSPAAPVVPSQENDATAPTGYPQGQPTRPLPPQQPLPPQGYPTQPYNAPGAMQPDPPYEDPYVPKKKGSASKAIIIGAIVVAALIIGGGIFWLTSRATDKQAAEWDETESGYVEEVADPEFSDVRPSGASASAPFDYTAMVCFRELTPADLTGCPKAELRLMRNTIYARHGYMFQSADLQEYFSQFDWYEPRLNVVTENDMSEIERKNVALIKRFE